MSAMTGSASTEIDAPIADVWALVQDVESAPAWQRGIDATDALARDDEGRATSCETVTDAKIKVFKARVSFDYSPPARLSWVQQQGDLKSMTGSWQLEDLGSGRTRATYSLQADPGALLSRFLKGALEQKMRAILIEGRPAELKARAEAAARDRAAGAAGAG
jgi:carbon monoxide dehydrogenase subunit G